MNKIVSTLLLAVCTTLMFTSCQNSENLAHLSSIDLEPTNAPMIPQASAEFASNGKYKKSKTLREVYTKTSFTNFQVPVIDDELIETLQDQLQLLRYRKNQRDFSVGNLDFSIEQLEETIDLLMSHQYSTAEELAEDLDAFQLDGMDSKGNVKYTGYFTPILEVSKTKTNQYRYPIYRYPSNWEGELPTRQDIDGHGSLEGLGLELAYAKNYIDLYFMMVQGSGIVQYRDGSQKLFAHNGSNSQPYRSVGKFMIEHGYADAAHVSLKSIRKYFDRNPDHLEEVMYANESYIFFKPVNTEVKGAGMVPLKAKYSIAVDPDIIPLGSVLLGMVPVIDENRKFSHHELRFLVAQDIGGAIKGSGHIDYYCGVGPDAKHRASNLHYYGGLWLIQPKEAEANTLISEVMR